MVMQNKQNSRSKNSSHAITTKKKYTRPQLSNLDVKNTTGGARKSTKENDYFDLHS